MSEIELSGGRITAGVVRVGDTVRRPPGPNAALVRSLLGHLDATGFDGAPRHLGTDEQAREIFTYLPGEVPPDLGWYDDPTLTAAAKLIRRYHDATASMAQDLGAEIICHNDLSPCNFVFIHGMPVALIDFDAAAPDSRAVDLGYAAWLWLDIGNPDIAVDDQRRRLTMFLHAYGDDPGRHAVVDGMMKRQRALVAEGHANSQIDMAAWANQCLDWTATHIAGAAP